MRATQTISWKPFSEKHKRYIKNALRCKMSVAEGSIRSGKTIDNCIIAAAYLEICKDERDGLKALASIVGIDIQADNCEESRKRLMTQFCEAFPNANEVCILLAAGILQNNIICGDSLKIMKEWEPKE